MEYFAIAAGISVHISDTGRQNASNMDKPCILLMHGYLESMYIWSEFTDLLSEKFRVISFDMPGHGLTDSAPAGEDGCKVNGMDFCADVACAVLDCCGVDKAVVCGHSMGGYAALQMGIRHPERCSKIVLMHSHPYPDPEEKAEDRKREIALIYKGKLSTIADLSIPKMYHPNNLSRLEAKIMETVELCEMHDPEGIAASIRGMQQREDTSAFLVSGSIPVMMICGDNDSFAPAELREKMQKDFPKVRFCLIADAGHNSFIEQPQETYQQLCDFIG